MKKEKYYSEEQKEIRSFIKILAVLVILFFGMYFLTTTVFNKEEKIKRTNNEGKVQYESIILGTLLQRADEEYYVLALDSKDVANTYIMNKASDYNSGKNSLPLYTADLDNEFNKKFVSKESSYQTDSIDNLKLKGTTLIKVKKNKIVEFVEGNENIANVLNKEV